MLALSLLITGVVFAANHEPTKLDNLIRGELAALQSYDAVLKDTKDKIQMNRLQEIRNDHVDAITILSKYTIDKPTILAETETAGAWGDFAKAWTKGAKLMGNKTALKALTQGEEHGINKYTEALEDKTLKAELKTAIRLKMIPAQKAHIEILKSFM
jgi:demethoxyubiquinone hydroxylase (CLK1/Coq7/Cat5 family)